MEYSKIRIENIGPIRSAEIDNRRLCVFVGPNNSGKSIASRLIHGVCQLDLPQTGRHGPSGLGAGEDAQTQPAVHLQAVLRSAGMGWHNTVTRGRDSGLIDVTGPQGCRLRLRLDPATAGSDAAPAASDFAADLADAVKRSVYVPAGRTGEVQSLLALAQIKSALLGSALRLMGGPPSAAAAGGEGLPRTGASLRLKQQLPDHLEQFYNMLLETLSAGLYGDALGMFSRLFAGSLMPSSPGGLPSMLYRDPSGFEVEIDSAGSGAVSAFPIVAGMYRVERGGGMLIIEDPEAHMEPIRQMKIADEVVRVALARDIRLVLTTHSDYVVHTLLRLVAGRILRPDDLGLYYFRRKGGSPTLVEKIAIDKTGEAEQEMFTEALDILAEGARVKDAP